MTPPNIIRTTLNQQYLFLKPNIIIIHSLLLVVRAVQLFITKDVLIAKAITCPLLFCTAFSFANVVGWKVIHSGIAG